MSTICPAAPPVDPDDDCNAAVLALVAAGVDGDTLAERVEALLFRVRELETLLAMYARNGVQA